MEEIVEVIHIIRQEHISEHVADKTADVTVPSSLTNFVDAPVAQNLKVDVEVSKFSLLAHVVEQFGDDAPVPQVNEQLTSTHQKVQKRGKIKDHFELLPGERFSHR